MLEQIKNLAECFFGNLGTTIDSVEVTEEQTDIYLVKVQTEESGLLIGPHGKNLESIENILKLMGSKKGEKRIKLHLEVNDYKSSKDERLHSFIKTKINLVLKTGKDIELPFYSAYDRKKIHGFVSEFGKSNIYTKSIGEDKERRLYICKKDAKLTIDIDGDDI